MKRGFSDRSEYTNEDHISYTCDGGYYPVSPDGTSVCQEDGTQKPEMPACKKVKNSERAFHKYSTDFSNGPTWFQGGLGKENWAYCLLDKSGFC